MHWREDGTGFILILDYKLILFTWNLSFQLVHCTSRKVNRNNLQGHQKTSIWSETEVPEGFSTLRSHQYTNDADTINHDHNVRLLSSPITDGIGSCGMSGFIYLMYLFK